MKILCMLATLLIVAISSVSLADEPLSKDTFGDLSFEESPRH